MSPRSSLQRYLTFITCFLLALAKRVTKLHSISYEMRHLKKLDLVAKTLDISVSDLHFQEFTILTAGTFLSSGHMKKQIDKITVSFWH